MGWKSPLSRVQSTAIRIMPIAQRIIGENFPLQFAWHLPDGDYLRSVFDAEVVDLVPQADKYIVILEWNLVYGGLFWILSFVEDFKEVSVCMKLRN